MIEDAVFGVGVDAGERVVEHEDARVADEGAGDGGALFLATREREAALANGGLVSLGETVDVIGDVGGFGDAANFSVGGVLGSEGDVFANCVAEQECLLRDEADVPAQQLREETREWGGHR